MAGRSPSLLAFARHIGRIVRDVSPRVDDVPDHFAASLAGRKVKGQLTQRVAVELTVNECGQSLFLRACRWQEAHLT
jgi:hypothetical protein